jgi:Mg-chelatase subunit ChlD
VDSVISRRTRRPVRAGTRRPLARKPKQLDEAPALLQLGRGSGGAVLTGGGRAGRRPVSGGSSAPGQTAERAELLASAAAGASAPADPDAHRIARQIARSLTVRRPARAGPGQRRGPGPLQSLPYRGGSDEVDLDRTIEVLAERPVPDDTDIIVRERSRTQRCVVLAVDVSGSMRGERVRTAAATVGALAAVLRDDPLAVLAFWSDAAMLLRLGGRVKPLSLLDDLLAIPARGLTNVAFPLEVARRELAGFRNRDQRVLLLTDAVHNAGPDPRTAAAVLPRLDVLLDVTGEHDLALGQELALAGHGRLYRITGHRDVAPALLRAFSM